VQGLNVSEAFISEKAPVSRMLAEASVKTDPMGCIITGAEIQTNINGHVWLETRVTGEMLHSREHGGGITSTLNIIRNI
jgi:hypothetical protein